MKIDLSVIQGLIESITRRIEAAINSKGGFTNITIRFHHCHPQKRSNSLIR
jgi:hypothetical protein